MKFHLDHLNYLNLFNADKKIKLTLIFLIGFILNDS